MQKSAFLEITLSWIARPRGRVQSTRNTNRPSWLRSGRNVPKRLLSGMRTSSPARVQEYQDALGYLKSELFQQPMS